MKHINEAHQKCINEAVVDMLRKELEIKNEQIRELNARLAESNAALVAAQQMASAAQALHAGTIQQQLLSGGEEKSQENQIPADPPQDGFFRRIFGKNKTENRERC